MRSCFESALAGGEHPFLLPAPDARTRELTGPDWTGLPTRVQSCLGRAAALAVLDGERGLQEEYVEWRVVRDDDGRLRRVELTTELRDHWRVLAAHEPERALEEAGELAGRLVGAEDLYGGRLPDTPDAREDAFVATMIERSNPLNDGRAAILFMRHRDNDLGAMFKILAAAASPCVLADEVTGRSRCATAYETIPMLDEAAVAGRASDPVIVERLGRLAFEGRLIAPDDPLGIAIAGVEHTRLRTPAGEPVPPEWFAASRGRSADESLDGHARSRRLVFEVPAEHGFAVGDLVDAATEQPIRHGGQIAELVQLRLLLRTSAAGVAPTDDGLRFDPDRARADPCEDVLALLPARARTG